MRMMIRRFVAGGALTAASLLTLAVPADAAYAAGQFCNPETQDFTTNAAGEKMACMYQSGGFHWRVV